MGMTPYRIPAPEEPAVEPTKRYWWKCLGLLVALGLLMLAGILRAWREGSREDAAGLEALLKVAARSGGLRGVDGW